MPQGICKELIELIESYKNYKKIRDDILEQLNILIKNFDLKTTVILTYIIKNKSYYDIKNIFNEISKKYISIHLRNEIKYIDVNDYLLQNHQHDASEYLNSLYKVKNMEYLFQDMEYSYIHAKKCTDCNNT